MTPKLFNSVLGAMLLLSLTATGMSAEEKQVGVLWFQKSGMAQRVLKGFVAGMKSKAPGIKIDIKMDLKDADTAAPIYKAWQSDKDAVLFLRSAGAKYMAANAPTVPGFIGAANDPVALGVVADMAKPGGMITGVTYAVPVSKQFELYRQLFPSMKSVGLLVKEGHPSSPVEQAATKKVCEDLGISYNEAVCADKGSLAKAVKAMLAEKKVDLLIMGNQNLLIDNGPLVALLAGKVPVMSYSEKPVTQKHALGGLVANDEKLGGLLADSVIAVIVDGTPVGEVPVKTDPEPRFLFNKSKGTELGISLPDALANKAEIIE